MSRLRLAFGLGTAATLLVAAPLSAQPAPPSPSLALSLPAAHGQQALALEGTATGLRARVCASAPCSPDGGALLPIAEEIRPLLARGRASAIELEGGRQLAKIELPAEETGPSAGGRWVMLLAAPLSGKGAEPSIVWSGWVGVPRGEPGEQRSTVLVEEPASDPKSRARRVLVGERRDDLTLCGRPTLVGAKAVDPSTLALGRGASVQNLSAEERAKATKIPVDRLGSEPRASTPVRLLTAATASSAVDKKLGTLTDGDVESTWSENKSGEGEGEFITFGAPAEIGISSLEIVIRPKEDIEGGAAPKTLYLATSDRLFELPFPEDAWKQAPGTRYGIKLPEAVHGSCFALVLGGAFAGKDRKASSDEGASAKLPRVTLAEIEAHSAFDGATMEGLVGALAGGGERAKAAAALLARGGSPAIHATISAFPRLDEAGQQLAEQVIDGAPCSDQVPFFAARLAALTPPDKPAPAPEKAASPPAPRPVSTSPGADDPARAHARDRLRRCGRSAAPALAALVREGARETRLLAAEELSLVAPGEAVPVLLDALAGADDPLRRELRASLARAAKSPHAASALRDELEPTRFAARSEIAAIDLLRATGPSLGRIEGAAQAFARLATPEASFRTRYLLQAPAAELAKSGEARAEAFLRSSLRNDPSPELRARAAEVAGNVSALGGDLAAAIADPEARVRRAAIEALIPALQGGLAAPSGLADALAQRLAGDDWTFVRKGAARAIGALPAAAPLDAALAKALADLSPEVRGEALEALGAHKATSQIEAVRARENQAEELPDVRARAIHALAALCDLGSVDAFTRRAVRAKAPLDELDRRLGAAAIAALGKLHPADLPARLAPLLTKDTPPMVREMARAALAAEPACPR
jgi:hypothetical protein